MSLLRRCMLNCPVSITLFVYAAGCYTNYCIGSANLYLLIPFYVFFALSLLSLAFAFFLSPGSIPESFSPDFLPEDSKVTYMNDFSEIDFSLSRLGFCKKCDLYRPPRCHHCSVCQKCILRFEHHCPFIGNCVGYRNQKSFILFLFYSACALMFLLIESVLYLEIENNLVSVTVTLIISGLLIFVGGFAVSQISMVLQNVTTLECKWSHRVFDTGSYRVNAEQVLGSNWLLWFVPCCTVKGGIQFPVRIRLKSVGYHMIENKFLI